MLVIMVWLHKTTELHLALYDIDTWCSLCLGNRCFSVEMNGTVCSVLCTLVQYSFMLQTAKWQVAAKECVENSEDEVKFEAKREVKLR